MPLLNIGLHKENLDYGDVELERGEIGAWLVARVRRLKDELGKDVREPDREELIPVGRTTQPISVEPGLYHIELVMPSGMHLMKQREVADSDLDVIFRPGGSPHEWLSWQHLEGAVPNHDDYHAQMSGSLKGVLRSPRGIAPGTSILRRSARSTPASAPAVDVGKLPDEAVTAPYQPTSAITLLGETESRIGGAAAWERLADALEGRLSLAEFSAGVQPVRSPLLRPFNSDQWFDSWRLKGSDNCGYQRMFAIVATGRTTELVCLPLPWETSGTSDLIELVVDKSEASRPFRTNVTILDPRFAGLFAYFKQGSFALARTVLEHRSAGDLEAILSEKAHNPLAAAAASYCLVAASEPDVVQRWHPWLERLSDRFPWIPDGAILAARLKGSCTGSCEAEVRRLYLDAFDRGLPFFALGLSWLRDGLRLFTDKQCREAAALVRRVSIWVDTGQACTILASGKAWLSASK